MYSKEDRIHAIITTCARTLLLLIAATWGTFPGRTEDLKESAGGSRTMTASFVNSMDVLNSTHKLGAGDQISFRVIEDEDPPRALSVTDSGEMEVPYLGRLVVTGKSCKDVAYEIKAALEKQYYYQASVILGLDVIAPKGTVSRGKIYLMGQVRTQGPQEIPADEAYTVSRAVLRAGGFADFADKRKVKLIRSAGKGKAPLIKIIDVKEVLEKGNSGKDETVEPDDIIVVPERIFNGL